jgi:hypothetical protein
MEQAKPWDQNSEAYGHHTATHTAVLTPEEARQGVISGRVRLVLLVSLMLAAVAFAIVFAVPL